MTDANHLIGTRPEPPVRVATSTSIGPTTEIGDGTIIWHLTQVREDAVIGRECSIGRGVYIDHGVVVGDRCKVRNGALVFGHAVIEDGAYIGPAAVLTEEEFPRAVNPDGTHRSADRLPSGVTVRRGAAIGANAVCVAPAVIGEWASVAAGSVVTADVQAYALVSGSPAQRIGWVGRAGVPLAPDVDGAWVCPKTGERYLERDGSLEPASV